MKHFLITILFFASKISILYSQGNVQEFEAFNKQNPDIHFQRMSFSDNTGYYCVLTNKKLKNYSFDKFDMQGKQLFSSKFKDEPIFELEGDNSIYVFSSTFDKSNGKKGKLFLSEINIKTGDKTTEKLIDEIEVIKEKDFTFEFSLSPDKTKLLLVSHYFCLSEELPEKTIFRLFDVRGMKQLWEKEIDAKFKDFYVRTGFYATDNDGNVFLNFDYASKIIEIKAQMGKSGMGIVNANEKVINEIVMSFDESVFVRSFSTMITNDGKLIILGVGTERKSALPRRAGVVFVSVDMKIGKVLNKKVNFLSQDVDKKLDYDNKGSGAVIFNAAEIIEKDNCYYFVANEGYSVYRTFHASTTTTASTNFSSRLLLIKIKPSTGEAEWTKVIPKSTSTKTAANNDSPALNYHTFVAGGKLHFVYLDHPANFDKFTVDNADYNKMGTIVGSSNCNVVLVSIEDNGTASKKLIFENKETCILPQQINLKLNKNSLLIYLENAKEKEEKFGAIIVN